VAVYILSLRDSEGTVLSFCSGFMIQIDSIRIVLS